MTGDACRESRSRKSTCPESNYVPFPVVSAYWEQPRKRVLHYARGWTDDKNSVVVSWGKQCGGWTSPTFRFTFSNLFRRDINDILRLPENSPRQIFSPN